MLTPNKNHQTSDIVKLTNMIMLSRRIKAHYFTDITLWNSFYTFE